MPKIKKEPFTKHIRFVGRTNELKNIMEATQRVSLLYSLSMAENESEKQN